MRQIKLGMTSGGSLMTSMRIRKNILVLGCMFDDLDEDQKENILVLGCVTARNISL